MLGSTESGLRSRAVALEPGRDRSPTRTRRARLAAILQTRVLLSRVIIVKAPFRAESKSSHRLHPDGAREAATPKAGLRESFAGAPRRLCRCRSDGLGVEKESRFDSQRPDMRRLVFRHSVVPVPAGKLALPVAAEHSPFPRVVP